MVSNFRGSISISRTELDLDLTLLGGQSFRWQKVVNPTTKQDHWRGVAHKAVWIINQDSDGIHYVVYPAQSENHEITYDSEYYKNVLSQYLRLDFDLCVHVEKWRNAHEHFAEIAHKMKAVRVLDQEPLENIVSFICSQNNHIRRISTMVNWFCTQYGTKIGHIEGRDEYTFPELSTLLAHRKKLEAQLRDAKFGYRAKFIAQAVDKIAEAGGMQWLRQLRDLAYEEARRELATLPGIGLKVADCICLMSLNHLQAVPIDTHIYKIAKAIYLPQLANVKAVTPKIYDDIAGHFRDVYGPYAGWAQTVLFCSSLQQFKEKPQLVEKSAKSKRRKKDVCELNS